MSEGSKKSLKAIEPSIEKPGDLLQTKKSTKVEQANEKIKKGITIASMGKEDDNLNSFEKGIISKEDEQWLMQNCSQAYLFLLSPIKEQNDIIRLVVRDSTYINTTIDGNAEAALAKLNGRKELLSIERAALIINNYKRYDGNLAVDSYMARNWMVAAADRAFSLNNKAGQHNADVVLPLALREKINSINLFLDALSSWIHLSSHKHPAIEKLTEEFKQRFVPVEKYVNEEDKNQIHQVAKYYSEKTVLACVRNWHYIISKKNRPIKLTEALPSDLILSSRWVPSDSSGLVTSVMENPVMKPLYQVQKFIIENPNSIDKEVIVAELLSIITEGSDTDLDYSRNTYWNGGRSVGEFGHMENSTQKLMSHQGSVFKKPTVISNSGPVTQPPKFQSNQPIEPKTIENFDSWKSEAFTVIRHALTMRNRLLTDRPEKYMRRTISDISKRTKPHTAPIVKFESLPAGGYLPSMELFEELTSKTIDQLNHNIHSFRSRGIGLAWGGLILALQERIDKQSNHSFGYHGEPLPQFASAGVVKNMMRYSVSLQETQESYRKLLELIDAAVSRADVRIYDIVEASNRLICQCVLFVLEIADINNALVIEFIESGLIIDDQLQVMSYAATSDGDYGRKVMEPEEGPKFKSHSLHYAGGKVPF